METRSKQKLKAPVREPVLTETQKCQIKMLEAVILQKRSIRFITIAEFCERYPTCPRTVSNWVRRGILEAVRDARGRIYRVIDPEWPIVDDSEEAYLSTLKPRQVAALLGVPPSTIQKMASRGQLKAMQVGTQKCFSIAEVQRAVAARAFGRMPRGRKEVNEGVIRWARWKLDHPGVVAPNRPIKP